SVDRIGFAVGRHSPMGQLAKSASHSRTVWETSMREGLRRFGGFTLAAGSGWTAITVALAWTAIHAAPGRAPGTAPSAESLHASVLGPSSGAPAAAPAGERAPRAITLPQALEAVDLVPEVVLARAAERVAE